MAAGTWLFLLWCGVVAGAAFAQVGAAGQEPRAVQTERVGGGQPRPPFRVLLGVGGVVELVHGLVPPQSLNRYLRVVGLGPGVQSVDAAAAGQEADGDMLRLFPGEL